MHRGQATEVRRCLHTPLPAVTRPSQGPGPRSAARPRGSYPGVGAGVGECFGVALGAAVGGGVIGGRIDVGAGVGCGVDVGAAVGAVVLTAVRVGRGVATVPDPVDVPVP